MSQTIYFESGGKLTELVEQPYDSEDLIQTLLAKYPNLLAGSQVESDEPRRWLLVAREAGIPDTDSTTGRWSLDHLFLDQEGVPTLVEVKRSTDTRIRREVVGQMLDYAANALVYWPMERIQLMFEGICRRSGRDPVDVLREFLGDKDEIRFWSDVKSNLREGRVRMVFVADDIPPELRRIVEFLNTQMDPAEVLAVEIKRFSVGGHTTYVPRLVGQTEAAAGRKGQGRWNEITLLEELTKRHGEGEALVASRILEWAKEKTTRVWFGQGARSGSFVPVYTHKGKDHLLFAVWTYGVVEIYFPCYLLRPVFSSEEKRRELLNQLNQIPAVALAPDSITRRPSIRLAALTRPEALQLFLQTFEWFLAEVKKS